MIRYQKVTFEPQESLATFTITGVSTTRHESRELTKMVEQGETIGLGQFNIKRVIFNAPATIVFWKDGTKTVVKCQGEDVYNKEVGLALCFAKKALGNKSRYNDLFKKYISESEGLA